MFLILKVILIGAFVTFISSIEIINSFDDSESIEIEENSFGNNNKLREEVYASQNVGKSHRFYYTSGERHEGIHIIISLYC